MQLVQVAGCDGEGIVQRTNGDNIAVIVGIERCSVKKIRRLTACRFESGPGHHSPQSGYIRLYEATTCTKERPKPFVE
jgi:hypothetical protein